MGDHIFISYSSKNKTIADAVCHTLEEHRLKCWMAPRDILPGSNYAEELIKAIDESKLFVLIFSKDSNESQHVLRECERAVSHGIPIVPFRIQDVLPGAALQYFIGPSHWLDAVDAPCEAHLNRLADTVDILLKQEDLSKKSTGEALAEAEALARKRQASLVRMRRTTMTLAAAVIILVAGVGGWYFWSQANNPNSLVPYQNVAAGFKLSYPQGWSKTEPAASSSEAIKTAAIFYLPTKNDAESLGVMYMPSQKGVTLDDVTSDNLNQTEEYVSAGQLQMLESGATNFGGQLGYKIVYPNAAQQNIKTEQVWTVKNDTVYQISFSAMPDHWSEYAGNAQKVIDSFQFT